MYKFLTAVFAATLLTSSAMAGVKVVEAEAPAKAEVPESITVVCSNDVKQGTLVLGDPGTTLSKTIKLFSATF